MGSGSWSSSTYKAFADSYTKKSREEIFHQRSLHEEMDLTKSKTHIRESRDSEEHPESLPVFIALDETGSMGSIPDKMIRDYLPKLMDSIIDSIGVKHPQILFMGVGDHECDYCPCQVGQFESSTVAINQCLSRIYLEGRGGGNNGESYLLPWIIAGNHTSIDSWEKRKQKGFLFTVGDEPTLTRISRGTLASLTGMEYERDYIWQEAYELACEKYHVFHIHVRHGSEHYDEVVAKQMKEILRENFIVCKPDEVVEAICEAMGKTLKGSSSVIEEVSAEKTVENTESKPNIFDIHRR